VEEFAREKGLEEHIPLLRKGALIAQNPEGFENIAGEDKLDDVECQALKDEV